MLRAVLALIALGAVAAFPSLILIKDAKHWRTGDPRHASFGAIVGSVLTLLILLGLSVAAQARPSPYPPVTQFNGDRYVGSAQLGAEVVRSVKIKRTKSHRKHYRERHPFRVQRPVVRQIALTDGMTRVAARDMGGRPAGCPSRFCGCGASLHLFGKIIPALNLAANWLRFPRAAPALDMVAARRGHVFVLKYHISGNTWMVFDANSGGRRTRIHPRSIAGFTIVNPYRSNS
jgi:hypothetical protein